jgi:hypothetical protein
MSNCKSLHPKLNIFFNLLLVRKKEGQRGSTRIDMDLENVVKVDVP